MLLTGHLVVLAVAAAISLIGAAALYWAWRSGHFEDVEEPKHRMMEEE